MYDRIENVWCIHPVCNDYEFEDQDKGDHDNANGRVVKLVSVQLLRCHCDFKHQFEVQTVCGVV